jgi:hypothetical protein
MGKKFGPSGGQEYLQTFANEGFGKANEAAISDTPPILLLAESIENSRP